MSGLNSHGPEIEKIVGVDRHRTYHYGRAVSEEQCVYILHSGLCYDNGEMDDCDFSRALLNGIELKQWTGFQDRPVRLKVTATPGGRHRLEPYCPPVTSMELHEALKSIHNAARLR